MTKQVLFWIVLGASIAITVFLMFRERNERKALNIPKGMKNANFYKVPLNRVLAFVSMLLVVIAGIIMFALPETWTL